MSFELEELELIDDDLEEVIRSANRYSFPTVTVGPGHIHFNLAFSQFVEDVDYLKISTSPQYIVFKPGKKISSTSFALSRPKNGGRTIIIPTALREKKPMQGTFRIYKFGDGWAFKRYEPLEVGA